MHTIIFSIWYHNAHSNSVINQVCILNYIVVHFAFAECLNWTYQGLDTLGGQSLTMYQGVRLLINVNN